MSYNKEEHSSSFRKMILTGRGQVTVTPDLAALRLGVQTTGDNVTAAQAENTESSRNVINSLRQLGITDIRTVQYQINKLYDYEDGRQIDRGYQVRNILEIRTDRMEDVGNVIDTAVYHGANTVESITFDVEDPSLYYQQALNLAVEDAMQKADAIAAGLQISFQPVPVLITESTGAPIPFRTAYAAREGSFSTPVEPGNMQIEANVTVEFVY
jgi:uncharacterized protein YggE